MESDFSILVNTTDSFEDCWEPFFKLFKFYWPTYSGVIYLNTENKDFSYEGLNIVVIKNGMDGNVEKWTNYLLHALEVIPQKYILYMQEDYFLKAPVNEKKLFSFLYEMKRTNISYINLFPHTRYKRKKNKHDSNLWYLNKKAKGGFNLQAAFWEKEKLIKFINYFKDHTPWRFEGKASSRAYLCEGEFCCLNANKFNRQNSPFPYFISVVRGQWASLLVGTSEGRNLLNRHNIQLTRRSK